VITNLREWVSFKESEANCSMFTAGNQTVSRDSVGPGSNTFLRVPEIELTEVSESMSDHH
jgi:hypothetical protein